MARLVLYDVALIVPDRINMILKGLSLLLGNTYVNKS